MIAGTDKHLKTLAEAMYSIISMPEDQYKLVYRLSGHIAVLLYPFQAFSAVNAAAALDWWKDVPWAKVPAPLAVFLSKWYGASVWKNHRTCKRSPGGLPQGL